MRFADPTLGNLLSDRSVWGTFLILVFLVFMFYRDVKNPEKAASGSILAGLTSTSTTVFAMAQQALDQAAEASKSAAAARESQARCERRVNMLIQHNHLLTSQLIQAGLIPVAMPPTTEDV